MFTARFAKSEPIEICNNFKYFSYWFLGYPFYLFKTLTFQHAEKHWLIYKC